LKEESFFPDGTKQKINSNGNKIVEFSDGSKVKLKYKIFLTIKNI